MSGKSPPKNFRRVSTRCCWNCVSIRSDSDGWFCSRFSAPTWSEFDLPFQYVCDLFEQRVVGAIIDVDLEAQEERRRKGESR